MNELLLFTNNLHVKKMCFKKIIEFDPLKETTNKFSVKIGWTKLIFRQLN